MNSFPAINPRAQEKRSAGVSRPDLRPRKSGNFCIGPRPTAADYARREKLAKPLTNGR